MNSPRLLTGLLLGTAVLLGCEPDGGSHHIPNQPQQIEQPMDSCVVAAIDENGGKQLLPCDEDADGDEVYNADEVACGTDPLLPDSVPNGQSWLFQTTLQLRNGSGFFPASVTHEYYYDSTGLPIQKRLRGGGVEEYYGYCPARTKHIVAASSTYVGNACALMLQPHELTHQWTGAYIEVGRFGQSDQASPPSFSEQVSFYTPFTTFSSYGFASSLSEQRMDFDLDGIVDASVRYWQDVTSGETIVQADFDESQYQDRTAYYASDGRLLRIHFESSPPVVIEMTFDHDRNKFVISKQDDWELVFHEEGNLLSFNRYSADESETFHYENGRLSKREYQLLTFDPEDHCVCSTQKFFYDEAGRLVATRDFDFHRGYHYRKFPSCAGHADTDGDGIYDIIDAYPDDPDNGPVNMAAPTVPD